LNLKLRMREVPPREEKEKAILTKEGQNRLGAFGKGEASSIPVEKQERWTFSSSAQKRKGRGNRALKKRIGSCSREREKRTLTEKERRRACIAQGRKEISNPEGRSLVSKKKKALPRERFASAPGGGLFQRGLALPTGEGGIARGDSRGKRGVN